MDTNSNAGVLFGIAGISCRQALAQALQGARICDFFLIMIASGSQMGIRNAASF
jgi:hypothetical protein